MMHVYFFSKQTTIYKYIHYFIHDIQVPNSCHVSSKIVNRFISFFLLRLIKILINKNEAKISIHRDFFFCTATYKNMYIRQKNNIPTSKPESMILNRVVNRIGFMNGFLNCEKFNIRFCLFFSFRDFPQTHPY